MESKVTFYHQLYLFFLSGTILFFLISIFLFIRLEIPTVIGFFTGSTERKGIKNLQRGILEKSEKNNQIQTEIHKVNHFNDTVITKRLMTNFEEVNEENTTLLKKGNNSFVIEQEIIIVHTKEVI